MENVPQWITELESTDISFIKQFVLSSGSLKEMSKIYGVSYPTMRGRLDQLIEKINNTKQDEESYVKLIRRLAIDKKIDFDAANVLIRRYREEKE